MEVIPQPGPIFPEVMEDEPADPEELVSEISTFANYEGIEDDDGSVKKIVEFTKRSPPFLKAFPDYQPLVDHLGGKRPVLLNFGLVVRTREGGTCLSRRPRGSGSVGDSVGTWQVSVGLQTGYVALQPLIRRVAGWIRVETCSIYSQE